MIRFAFCIIFFASGLQWGLSIGKQEGREEVRKEAIERGYAYRRFVMAGVKDHYSFAWNNDPYYPFAENP